MSIDDPTDGLTEGMPTKLRDFHIADPDGDPYPLFASLRAKCPVARSERYGGFWLLSTYELQHAALKDPKTFSSRYSTIPPVQDQTSRLLPLNYDPPEHTEYRNTFAPWFSPAVIDRAEPGMRERVRALIGGFVANGGGDFVTSVAVPFPVETFLSILGLPLGDTDQLLEWKDASIRDLLSGDPEKIENVQQVIFPAITGYFQQAIEARRAAPHPPDDVLTRLVHARVADRAMTDEEMVQALTLFMQAGLDTVTGMLGLFLAYLAQRSEQWAELVADRGLVPAAVEELLRYWSSVTLCRQVTEDVEIGGTTLRAGEMVMLPTQSAGRDESHCPAADIVDFHRGPVRHLGFGGGPHRCLGSHLARMELRIVLEELAVAAPRLELAPGFDPELRFGVVMGVDELQLKVS